MVPVGAMLSVERVGGAACRGDVVRIKMGSPTCRGDVVCRRVRSATCKGDVVCRREGVLPVGAILSAKGCVVRPVREILSV